MSSIETQQELQKFFQILLNGMRRLDMCLQFISEVTDNTYIPPFFVNQVCKLDNLSKYFSDFNTNTSYDELKDLIGRLGGFDEKLTFIKFQERYLKYPGFVLRKEADITFFRLLYEELKLERALDEQRIKIFKRWDYNSQTIFKKLSCGSNIVDIEKLKKFFIRIRQTVTDEDINLIMKRIGNAEGNSMSYDEFCQTMKTQKQRSQDRIEIPQLMKSSIMIQKKDQSSYMDKLRRKYKPLQLSQNIKQSQLKQNQQMIQSTIKGCHTPRAKTPIISGTEIKQPRTRTPNNQNTEPRYYYCNETKELNNLMSTYLNQQKCLQNVLAQLEEVVILKSINPINWHQEWQRINVNSTDIDYQKFINILSNYDERLPSGKLINITDLPNCAQTVADNLFDLLRDQEQQLYKAKIQFLNQGSLSILDKYFIKGYIDVLDMLQILENSTLNTVNIQDAELIIARFNKFNGNKTITRKALINELT